MKPGISPSPTSPRTLLAIAGALALAACASDPPRPAAPAPAPRAVTALPPVSALPPIEVAGDAPAKEARKPDVIFVPTPEAVARRMLQLAKVTPRDVVYDLGCGDGRIVIAAARDFGARAVGIDIDPQRVKEARANVKRAGLEDKVEIRQGDLFQVDVTPATVVTLYLLETLNLKLRPKLQKELRPGARIVSQSFSMGDWKPARTDSVDGTSVYVWNIDKDTARKAERTAEAR